MRWMLALIAAPWLLSSAPAFAQDDEEEAESPSRVKVRSSKEGIVREINRGFYVRASAGSTIYLMNRAKILRPGTTLDLVVGGDFIDKEKASAAFEFTFGQAIHNGQAFDQQGDLGYGPSQLIQGDIHTFSLLVGVEGSAYPVRRLGIGGHIGGGVMFVPLLMNRQYYDEEVVGLSQGDGAWGGPQNAPTVHNGVKPVIYVGPTIEYYTKLSHLSFGLDADVVFPIGLDLGLKITGFLKYSF
jgi:hypothetical protein